ncbi:MAG: FAD-dependent oxidoreductase [Verrucomicrobia bacterium]|nr:FAD-dependent oxidoreductase [Verrucomicrobiota bacterium]
MRLIHHFTLAIALMLSARLHVSAAPESSSEPARYDVVVIGGTPAGIAAGIAAARMGKSVVIVEQAPVLGGALSSGVLRLDDQYIESNTGVMEEFRQRVTAYHREKCAEDPIVKAHLKQDPRQRWNTAVGRAWEPHIAARIYAELVAEQKSITTRFNEVPVDVVMSGDRVTGVITRDYDLQGRLGARHTYMGSVIIDATYEADLAAFAKVPFRIGREARSPEEPHAGKIYTDFFRKVSDTLPNTILPGSTGESDDRSMAFTYRIVGKNYGRPDHPYLLKSPPPGYDPAKYDWNPKTPAIIPNGKFDLLGVNWGGDLTGYGTRWVLANWDERAEIAKIFRNHDLGYLYYIQTKGGSPNIGLPDDEFTDNGNFPYRLYVRQGRRIEGRYTVTESDMHKDLRGNGLRGPLHADSVAIGVYNVDSHHVQNPTMRPEPRSGPGAAEGTLHTFDITAPYQIPYGALLPRERKGIIFPVGISSTHIAMSSIRMEPVWSELGQAAGVAAALAITRGVELADVPVPAIQKELLRQKCALIFFSDLPADAPAFYAVQRLSLLGAAGDLGIEDFCWSDSNSERLRAYPAAYEFRPNDLSTRGEFARMLVKALQIPLSITASHFEDVPRGHPAFKYIETIYDHSTQSAKPFLDYEESGKPKARGKAKAETRTESPAARVHPDASLTGADAVRILSGMLRKELPAPSNPNANLTRGEAAQMLYHQLEAPNEP